jgi:hypothetical protein
MLSVLGWNKSRPYAKEKEWAAFIIAPWIFSLFLAHNQNIPQQKKRSTKR